MGIAGEFRILTLSQEDTRSRSLWLEKRRLEMPSEGGWESSRPPLGVVAVLMSAGARRGETVCGSGGGTEENRKGREGEGTKELDRSPERRRKGVESGGRGRGFQNRRWLQESTRRGLIFHRYNWRREVFIFHFNLY